MKAPITSLLNSLILITFGLWGYLSSTTPSITALIPVAVGLVLIFLYKGIKNENKIQAHIAVVLTVLVFVGLVKPLLGSLGREDHLAVFRVSLMLFTTLITLIAFIKSFIAARKNK